MCEKLKFLKKVVVIWNTLCCRYGNLSLYHKSQKMQSNQLYAAEESQSLSKAAAAMMLNLSPVTRSVTVTTEAEAKSTQLLKFCTGDPIVVVKGMPLALNLSLEVFSTLNMFQSYPRQKVEVREQLFQVPEKNVDPKTGLKTWACSSRTTDTTNASYTCYQASAFLENSSPTLSESTTIKFATNIDLIESPRWRNQLHELRKMPGFLRVDSVKDNMLCHLGHQVVGMNTVQAYLKVGGCRTPAHQENNNVCSVNFNTGPGDCEWFAVAYEYWEKLKRMCDLHRVDFLRGSWWPDLEELKKEGIPVYRFTQNGGDIVFVNIGCVHWVQALGCCNNFAWNVAPFTAPQFEAAMERYEWNKGQRFQSLVPMVHLAWNLARNRVLIPNHELFQKIRLTLLQSILFTDHLLELSKKNKVRIERYLSPNRGDSVTEPPHYCACCNAPVFNLHFIRTKAGREQQRRRVSDVSYFCGECAIKSRRLAAFECFWKHDVQELTQVYDTFCAGLEFLRDEDLRG